MAHNIDNSTGRDSVAYVGDTPWHGLGQQISREFDVQQVQEAAQLNWEVGLMDLEYKLPVRISPNMSEITRVKSGMKSLIRLDTGAELSVAGKMYQPFQNSEIFNFFHEYVEAGDMHIETAGALAGGKYVWAMATMDESFKLPGNDEVGGHILMFNPHVYGKSAIVKFTTIRVVCQNTLTAALDDNAGAMRLSHNTKFTGERAEKAKQHLGIAREKLSAFQAVADELARTTVSEEMATDILVRVFTPGSVGKIETSHDLSRTVTRLLELRHNGIGQQLASADGTAWGLLNSVTQYLDWERGRTASNRLMFSWLGGGESLKVKTINTIVKYGDLRVSNEALALAL